jgi:hypothetical protein
VSNTRAQTTTGMTPLRPGGLTAGAISPAAKASRPGPSVDDELTAEQRELLLDVGQIVLDIVGIFEPTPFADTTNAVISVTRSDWSGAGLSLLGTIPYLGDLAKAGKFPRYLKTVERTIVAAQTSPRFARMVRPLLVKIYCALDLIPESLPKSVRDKMFAMRSRIAAFAGSSARIARARQLIPRARELVNDPDDVLDTIEALLENSAAKKGAVQVDDFLAWLIDQHRTFDGPPTLRVTRSAELASRASDVPGAKLLQHELAHPPPWQIKGGNIVADAADQGTYLIPNGTLAHAFDRQASAVPTTWNKMLTSEIQSIPAGSIILEGKALKQGELSGGGMQIAHLGQLGADGIVRPRQTRAVVDGVNRTLGGQFYKGDYKGIK